MVLRGAQQQQDVIAPSASLSRLQGLLEQRGQLATDVQAAELRLAELERELRAKLPMEAGAGDAVSMLTAGRDGLALARTDAVGVLLADLDKLTRHVRSARSRKLEVERSISNLGDLIFERMPESVVPTLSPILRRVLSHATSESEVFRLLRAKIQFQHAQQRWQCIGMVSASPGEGKTTAALGLALSLASERNRRVILIEADLRRPTIERYLGLPRRVGLGDWLRGDSDRLRVRYLDPPGLHLLTAGSPGGQPAELLRSARMEQLIEVVRRAFDFVIVDCPPPAPLADSVIVQDYIDGFLLVVRGRHTPREEVRAALANLRPNSIRGVVFNDFSEILPRYYSRGRKRYYYYYTNDDEQS